MTKKKNGTKSTWIDPDDAPELTDEWFQKADLYEGTKLLRRGRPRKPAPKISIHLRLDPDIAKRLRATGRGWQTRLNAMLRTMMTEHRL